MAIKLTTTAQAARDSGLKLLVHGPAGAGKTTLCATTGEPTVIISAEAGLLSLRGHDIPVIEVGSIEDVHEAYRFVAESADARDFRWVCLDSISEIAEECPEIRANRAGHPLLAETMPTSLAARSDRGTGNLNHALGQGFKRMKGLHCDGFVLELAGNDPRTNVGLWRVRALKAEAVAEPSRSGIRFLDLLHRAGHWSGARQHDRIPDSRCLCARTVSHLRLLAPQILNLPEIPTINGPGCVEALRAWAQHLVLSLNTSTPTTDAIRDQSEAIVTSIIALPTHTNGTPHD